MIDKKSKDLQLQYQGYLQTPFLWIGKGVFGLQQFRNSISKTTSYVHKTTEKLRLGKLVERFVANDLQQDATIKIIAENIQIQQEKLTLGELDCILLQQGNPVHLEIVYKFYLYDSSVGNSEIEHWIGPNRRDSLVEKLTKLKDKQLPLLYAKECLQYLNSIDISPENISQQVFFKAQLFVPLHEYGAKFPLVNNDCITGFYINVKGLDSFNACKFHIPTKHNWLVQPHTNIDWLSFSDFLPELQLYLDTKKAPLCWLKKPNGTLFKFFVVWW